MKLRVSTYLAALVAVVNLLVLAQSWPVGMALLVASAATVLPLYWLPVPKQYFYILLFVAATLWVTHLARILVLAGAPELRASPRCGDTWRMPPPSGSGAPPPCRRAV